MHVHSPLKTMRTGHLKTGKMLFWSDETSVVLGYRRVKFEFGELEKSGTIRQLFEHAGEKPQPLCFGDVIPMTKRVQCIFGDQRLHRSGKSRIKS